MPPCVSYTLALSLKEDSNRWAVQRGFHIIFAVAAVDSVRRNFCSSYLSLDERETVVSVDWIKEGQKMFACVWARVRVCV